MRRLALVTALVLVLAACSAGTPPWSAVTPPLDVTPSPSPTERFRPATTGSGIAQGTEAPVAMLPAPGVLAVARDTPREPITAKGRADAAAVATGDTDFALDVYRELAKKPGNVVLGPGTISTALSMVLAGARGETAAEMREVLHALPGERHDPGRNALDALLRSRNREGLQIRMANQLWAQDGVPVDEGYAKRMARFYGAPTAALDFADDAEAARNVINTWVRDRTRERIPELFKRSQVDGAVLVLVSAVAFDGRWRHEFDRVSEDGVFQLGGGKTATVPMMSSDHSLPAAWGDGWQAVELPYVGDELSMLVVVPDDLEGFERSLDRNRVRFIAEALESHEVYLYMPRFKVRHRVDLPATLRALGMTRAFEADADFTAMLPGGARLDRVIHEAWVKVDEKGTEAAAATGVTMSPAAGPTILVDRPFLFFVRERSTGAILFLGRVADPRG